MTSRCVACVVVGWLGGWLIDCALTARTVHARAAVGVVRLEPSRRRRHYLFARHTLSGALRRRRVSRAHALRIFLARFGRDLTRAQSYCTNVSRTFFIDPNDKQTATYKALVKVYDAIAGEMKPGRRLGDVYQWVQEE